MKAHLKRLAIPKTWDIKRKTTTFIMRPQPSGQGLNMSMPIQIVLRDMLKVAKTAKEVRYILNHKEIFVNGTRRKDPKIPVGLMDVLEIPDLKKSYRLLLSTRGKLIAVEIDDSEKSIKPCKILNKTHIKGGKIQLNFTDGGNLLIDKDAYKTDDVVLLDFKNKKITQHLKFEIKASAFLIGGSRIGYQCSVKEIKGDKVILNNKDGEFETSKKYVFVVGTDKPMIKLE